MAEPCCFGLLLSSACTSDSLHSKAARLLDGREQLVVQFVVVLVGRNVDPIETGKTEESRFLNDILRTRRLHK